MRKTYRLAIVFILAGFYFNNCFAQDININSIHTGRELSGDGGYTLDGAYMIYSRAKLLDSQNFGPSGTYPHTVHITDGYSTSGSLTQVVNVPENEIFFFGAFNMSDAGLVQFTTDEIDSLYQWSKRGGKLIIGASATVQGYTPNVLNSKWGFDIVEQTPNVCNPTTAGNNTAIFSGPFGTVASATQGGSAEGYFDVMPPNTIVLATGVNDSPTLILDCNTLDLIVADVDVYTSIGLITQTVGMIDAEDMFWANTIAFMDQLESPPAITVTNGNALSTTTYSAYQWYLNDTAIAGASGQQFVPDKSGSYKVQVTLKCGCVLMSDTVMFTNTVAQYAVPNAFTPNADGKNDVLYVIGNGIDNMTFTIYDRWGEKVFESHNIAKDGMALLKVRQ
jgi:hypothetical protein